MPVGVDVVASWSLIHPNGGVTVKKSTVKNRHGRAISHFQFHESGPLVLGLSCEPVGDKTDDGGDLGAAIACGSQCLIKQDVYLWGRCHSWLVGQRVT